MLLGKLFGHLARLARRAADGTPLDLPEVPRRHGSWHHADLDWLTAKVAAVPGDFAEIGVFRGAAFRRVATRAAAQHKLAHAFDSFAGMAEPGPADGTAYPKGMFDIGGSDAFVALMDKAGVPREHYRLWAGYVPDCLNTAPPELRFSFVILDLDHYQPTVEALHWLTPRINAGGLLALDDFVPAGDGLATRAIREFLATDRAFAKLAFFNQQLILRKRD